MYSGVLRSQDCATIMTDDNGSSSLNHEIPPKKNLLNRRRMSGEGTYFYEVLGLNKDASSKDIKKAYHKKALENHPDRNPDIDEAESNMARISQAYSTLSDKDDRKVYDRWGSKGIYAGKNLESMNRVNGLTMFILKWTGSFPENTNE